MNPQNAIIGDNTGVELPQKLEDESAISEERKMAKYSRSSEFKRIQEWCEDRIKFYQTFLPNGAEVGLEAVPTTEDWRVANRVIGELKALLNGYALADEVVKQEAKTKNV